MPHMLGTAFNADPSNEWDISFEFGGSRIYCKYKWKRYNFYIAKVQIRMCPDCAMREWVIAVESFCKSASEDETT